ncbi:restriction endonuclease subunit S [Bacillus alveayuensis]|uniref:restriction endonuclease subunit S n=1 Tax=Aeribacillus alveayuensis TaxID=279215 RepID=UPI000696B5CC|nr:restriction endonuclease subunit S [Bacillus alveayuensis]
MTNKFVDLVSICDFQGGTQPPKKLWTKSIQEGYVRMLQIRDFTQGNVEPEYVPITKSIKFCTEDDVLIARYGASVGKILTGLSGAYNVAIMKTIPNTQKLLKRYLYYYLKSNIFQNFIKNVGGRSAQAGFNKQDLSKLKIYLPSLEMQKKIVDILDQTNLLIEKRKQQILTLSSLKKSIFLDMFGDPITNRKELPIDKLGNLTTHVSSGVTPKGGSKSYIDKGIPLIRSQNVLVNELDLNNVVYISNDVHQKMKRSQLLNRDVLFNITGASIGRSAVYEGKDNLANVNQHVCIIRVNKRLNPYYLSYFLNSDYFQKNIVATNNGATRQAFNYSQIKEFKLMLPDIDLQNEFERKIKIIDKMIKKLKEGLNDLEKLLDSLTQKAFNGDLFND